jgi:hypothetical protein
VVSILRLQSLVAISNSHDQTYDNPPAATWSSVETNIGIICSCLPCLRPLSFPGAFSSHKHSGISAPPNDRRAFGRHSAGPDTLLDTIDASKMRRSSYAERRDDRIKVVTEVRVSVGGGTETDDDRQMRIQRENSTEMLVGDVGVV